MEVYQKVGNVIKLMEDEKVVSLKDYKSAKVHLENLEHINKVLTLTIKSLTYRQAYKAAFETVLYCEGQQILVEAQIKKFKKILNKKEKK